MKGSLGVSKVSILNIIHTHVDQHFIFPDIDSVNTYKNVYNDIQSNSSCYPAGSSRVVNLGMWACQEGFTQAATITALGLCWWKDQRLLVAVDGTKIQFKSPLNWLVAIPPNLTAATRVLYFYGGVLS